MTTAADNLATATAEIQSQVDAQQAKALAALDDAGAFLQALQNSLLFTPAQLPDQTPVNVDLTVAAIGAIPPGRPTSNINAIKATIPTEPGDFSASVADRAIQSAPQETFSPPVLTFPVAPTFLPQVKPSSPTIALPDNLPDVPDITIPTALTVSTQTVPNIPSISLPDWGETIPALDIDLPPATFAYVEPVYVSALKDLLNADLIAKITNGGTGLNATIEGNIWNRDVERIAQNLSDNIDDTLNRFSGRGFTMPPGTVAAQVQELQINHTNDRTQASRDVAIEMAKIADENTKAFLRLGLTLEELQINHANNIANRALEAEKAVLEYGISLFNVKVAKFNAQLSRYQAKAIETENRIKIENLKLDQYKAELQGVEAQATKDRVSIENYKAILSAQETIVRLYIAEVNAVIAAMNIERAKVEIFKSEIDAFIANIDAQRSEYDLFLAQIEGEKAKIGLHKSEVDAYVARVTAVKISNDVVIAKINSDISVEELNLRAHIANVGIWSEKVRVALQELAIEKDFYDGDIRVYAEAVRMALANANLNLQADVKAGQFEQAQAKLNLQKAIADMNALIEQSKFRITKADLVQDGFTTIAGVANSNVQSLIQLGSEGRSEVTE